MKQLGRGNSIAGIAALLVFAVFAVSILSVLLSGAGVYQRLSRRDQSAYQSRTGIQYLATKVRQAEAPPWIEAFCGCDALVLSQKINGTEYLTRIYCHDGWLRELFSAASGEFSPEDGEKILPMDALSLSLDGVLLTATLRNPDGAEVTLTLASRLRKEVLP